ncbi:MAG: BrxE family protein [Desulfatibacillaceae bacterium]
MPANSIDFGRLLKQRLAVARFGEMDCAKWWNTQGILGPYGPAALSRGFPRTHLFAQARIAFAVAGQRCKEVYSPPNAVTLWALPPEIEDAFQEHWQTWLDDVDSWRSFFTRIETAPKVGLPEFLSALNLISDQQASAASSQKIGAEGKSVPISWNGPLSDQAVTLLSACFAKASTGNLLIPYLPQSGLDS